MGQGIRGEETDRSVSPHHPVLTQILHVIPVSGHVTTLLLLVVRRCKWQVERGEERSQGVKGTGDDRLLKPLTKGEREGESGNLGTK